MLSDTESRLFADSGARGAGRVILEARGLVVRAGRRILLGPVDLAIREGERIGLLGPSGCGKSQLLDRLLGLQIPRRGDGRVIFHSPAGNGAQAREERTQGVSAVFQTNALFDTLSVRRNLAIAAGGRADEGEIAGALRRVGLDPDADAHKFPAELSGGMQRRVALARALLARPRLLALDEPLAGLDGESRRIVMETLLAVWRESEPPPAILLIEHHYEFVAGFCDRLLWIDPRGRRLIEVEGWRGAEKTERLALIQDFLQSGKTAGGAPPPAAASGAAAPGGAFSGGWRELRETARSFAGAVAEAPRLALALLHGPFSGARPGRDFLESFLRASALAMPYVGLIFALLGLLITLQSERTLRPLGLSAQIPEAVTRGIVQGIGPLLLALLMAGRSGSAIASEIGAQTLSRQVDMWKMLGRDPREVLFAPRAWGMILALPLMLLFALFLATGAGWLYYALAPQASLTATAFWRGALEAWSLRHTLEGMIRVALDGFALVALACLCGSTPKRAAEDVAEAATRAVVLSGVAFLLIETLWSFLFI